MRRKNLVRTFIVGLMAVGTLGQASAASLDALQGAWTMNGTDCAAIFKGGGGKAEFIDRTATTTTGVIIAGSKIEGPNTACTAQKIREEKDHFVASLSCDDGVMFDSYSVAFRMVDSENFERFDPQFPEASIIYHKCEF
jgi:hypothetical protein